MAKKDAPIKSPQEEIRAIVLESLPREISQRDIKYWLGHRSELANLLRRVIERKPLDTEDYETSPGDYGH